MTEAVASTLTDDQRTERIRAVVTRAGEELRERHPILRRQDAIGAGILVFSLAGMIACAWLYGAGVLPAWACIPLVAILASFTHELEHDLIHYLYFRNRPVPHNLMLALAWLARPSTINPWIRRHLHFHHHKHSGTATDREERGITNGEPWSLLRAIMLGDLVIAILVRVFRMPTFRDGLRLLLRGLAAMFPLAWIHYALWYWWLGFHGADVVASSLGSPIAWSADTLAAMRVVDFLFVVLVAPNMLRGFCLHFVSSNMHYYGDIEDGNLMQQTQVLTPWWMAPMQLFCFNFGGTHAIHHFVVKEPFYIRQVTAKAAYEVMREVGVRFNDTGTFRRANRWRLEAAA